MIFEIANLLLSKSFLCVGQRRTVARVRACPGLSGCPDKKGMSAPVRPCPENGQVIDMKRELVGHARGGLLSGQADKALSEPDKRGERGNPPKGVPLPAPVHARTRRRCPMVGSAGDE